MFPDLDAFPEVDYQTWRDQLTESLGADPEKRLANTLLEGFSMRPLYTAADALHADAHTRGIGAAPPTLRALIDHVELADVRAQLDEDRAGGAQAILLDMLPGRALADPSRWSEAFEGGALGPLQVHLRAQLDDQLAGAEALLALWSNNPAYSREGSLGLDPYSDAHAAVQLDAFKSLLEAAPIESNLFEISTLDGENAAQALGLAAARGVALMRDLDSAGMDATQTILRARFLFALDADVFLGMATLRAARRIWSRVTEACGLGAQRMRLSAQTNPAALTKYDPWVNILRGTTSAFAAMVSGAEILTVLPFDQRARQSDAHARRLARNTALVLAQESGLAQVEDPGGGSWYLEQLTESLAQAGWSFFQQIEAQGGARQAQGDWLKKQFSQVRADRDALVHKRKRPFTGLSEFPNLSEARLAGKAPHPQPPSRGHAFEALRDRAQRADTPTMFMANLGPLAEHLPRATFAKNALAAGGISAIDQGGFEDAEALVKAFSSSGARGAILCGADPRYEQLATEAAQALKRAGAALVLLAGRYESPDIDDQLYLGVDLASALTRALDALEAQS